MPSKKRLRRKSNDGMMKFMTDIATAATTSIITTKPKDPTTYEQYKNSFSVQPVAEQKTSMIKVIEDKLKNDSCLDWVEIPNIIEILKRNEFNKRDINIDLLYEIIEIQELSDLLDGMDGIDIKSIKTDYDVYIKEGKNVKEILLKYISKYNIKEKVIKKLKERKEKYIKKINEEYKNLTNNFYNSEYFIKLNKKEEEEKNIISSKEEEEKNIISSILDLLKGNKFDEYDELLKTILTNEEKIKDTNEEKIKYIEQLIYDNVYLIYNKDVDELYNLWADSDKLLIDLDRLRYEFLRKKFYPLPTDVLYIFKSITLCEYDDLIQLILKLKNDDPSLKICIYPYDNNINCIIYDMINIWKKSEWKDENFDISLYEKLKSYFFSYKYLSTFSYQLIVKLLTIKSFDKINNKIVYYDHTHEYIATLHNIWKVHKNIAFSFNFSEKLVELNKKLEEIESSYHDIKKCDVCIYNEKDMCETCGSEK
jgi:hypothetical protein